MFYFEEINGKKILKSNLLSGLNHAFTTRESVIRSSEEGMDEIIQANKIDICNYLDVEPENLICPNQTHSANIEQAVIGKTEYPQTDALILTNKVQAVYLNFADCTPIILFDKKQNICAVVHAGWRGTAERIAAKTVNRMKNEYGSTPQDIVAAIGPAIDECCFCIGEDVKEKLAGSVNKKYGLFRKTKGKIYANLKKINAQQLISVGVEKIDLCDDCTSCTNQLFFSYRKENGTTSRHSAVVKLQ